MTPTQISVVLIETNPYSSAGSEPQLVEEYRDLPQAWLSVLDYMLGHPDMTVCWRCDDSLVGFVAGEAGTRWVPTGLAREGDGLVAMLCPDCTPYVPAPSLPTLASFRFPGPQVAAYFQAAEQAQQPGVTGRAWRGEFAERDLVAANVGAPLRPIRIAGLVLSVDGGNVRLQTERGVIDVPATDVRHARIVSDAVCQLYGVAPKPYLEVVR